MTDEPRATSWETEDRFRMLAAAVADYSVFMTDPGRVIRTWNPGAESVFGYAEAEAVGRSADMLFTPEDRAAGAPEAETRTALADGKAGDNRWHLRKDGRRFWTNGVTVPLFADDGRHLGFAKVARDETVTKTLLDDAERRGERPPEGSDAGRSLALATLAHELKSPLAAIRMGVSLVEQDLLDGPARKEMCRKIAEQADDLMHLVDDLLDAARTATGKIVLRRERVAAAELMRRAADAVAELIAVRRIELAVVPAPEGLCVDADPLRLKQVFVNLLTNAAKYTAEGGTVRFEAAREGDEIAFRVIDSGVGISREMIPKVFDMFFQIGHSFQRSGGGLGIGLAVVRNLVKLHGGTVEVNSEGPGKGSEFVVRLAACG